MTLIYLVFEKESGAPIYVGKTYGENSARFSNHRKRFLAKHGLVIDVLILEHVNNESNWQDCEKKWIAWFREFCKLDNKSAGGLEFPINGSKLGGVNGGKIGGLKGKGKKKPELSKLMKGRKRPDLSEILKGRIFSSDHREKLRKAALGKPKGPMSDAQKLKISKTTKGKPHSDSHNFNVSISTKAYWKTIKAIVEEENVSYSQARALFMERKR